MFSNMRFSSPGLLKLFIWLCLMAPRGADKCWRSQAPKLWSRSGNETFWNTYVYLYFFLHFGNLIIIIPHYLICRCLREHLVSMPKKPHVNLQGIFCACLCLRICWVRKKRRRAEAMWYFLSCVLAKTRSLLQVGSSMAQESQLIEDLRCWRRTT